MAVEIYIVEVEKDGLDGLVVTFSDGTSTGYTIEELLELRPHRLLARAPAKGNGDKPIAAVMERLGRSETL
jgi:hypothetical protein